MNAEAVEAAVRGNETNEYRASYVEIYVATFRRCVQLAIDAGKSPIAATEFAIRSTARRAEYTARGFDRISVAVLASHHRNIARDLLALLNS